MQNYAIFFITLSSTPINYIPPPQMYLNEPKALEIIILFLPKIVLYILHNEETDLYFVCIVYDAILFMQL